MTKINLPFSSISLINATEKHKNYFSSQFKEQCAMDRITCSLEVVFKRVAKPLNFSQAESDVIVAEELVYIADTKQKYLVFSVSDVEKNTTQIVVDPEFDLYYLYSFLLEPLLIIKLCHKGILVLHASGVVNKNNEALIFPAWRHTGKTDLLLSFAKKKYDFLADDYCVIHNKKAYSYPKHINLFSYNLEKYKNLYTHLPVTTRLRLKMAVFVKESLHKLSHFFSGALGKVLYRVSQLAEVSTNIKLNPKEIGMGEKVFATFKTIFLLENTNLALSIVTDMDSKTACKRLTHIILYELHEFFQIYRKIVFLNPNLGHKYIETFETRYSSLIQKQIPTTKLLQLSNDKHDLNSLPIS